MAPEAATGDIEMSSSYAEEVQPVQVVFDKVCIDVKLPRASRVPCLGGERPIKRILDQVSGIFGPAECTACMGPSGSGKTTLLNALTGVTKPSSGSITANGQPFEPAAMRRVSALVPQDDLLTPSLTTHEALMEATIFKTSLGLAERQARVDRLLKQFGLDGCKDVIIGHPEGKKGISGGQKRRLSVALELCGRPSLLYLDEPTSGLDSIASMTLVRLLATLARGGVTVIATIHQPSAAAFYTFDRLLLLHQGSICYQGPIQQGAQPVAFFEGAGHPCPKLDNPADFLFEVLVDHAEKIRSKFQTEGVPDDAGRAADASLEPLPKVPDGGPYPSRFSTQIRTHMLRNVKAMKRDPMLARLRVGSATMVGLALGILYMDLPATLTGINERVTLLLFAMLFLSIINAIPVVIAILPELAVVRKEARNNWYSPFSWVPAKLAVETPLLVLPPAIFLTIVGNMTGLTRDADASRFFHLYLAVEARASSRNLLTPSRATSRGSPPRLPLVCQLVVWSVHAWALFLCAIAPSTEIAVLLAPGSIMPMAVFSGFFVNQQDMTWVFRWFSYIDFLNYAWQAMATAGFVGLTFEDAPPGLQTGEQVLENRLRLPSSDLEGYWRNIAFLSIFVVFFRVLSTVMISRRLVK